MNKYDSFLEGFDLRSLGNSKKIISTITTQEKFDELVTYLQSDNRVIAMLAADVIEKVTKQHVEFLCKHKNLILQLLKSNPEKEIAWHIALLIPRLNLTAEELINAWSLLSAWTTNKRQSKIVRVNSLQSLFDLSQMYPSLKASLFKITTTIASENIPSINARIKKLGKIGLKITSADFEG